MNFKCLCLCSKGFGASIEVFRSNSFFSGTDDAPVLKWSCSEKSLPRNLLQMKTTLLSEYK